MSAPGTDTLSVTGGAAGRSARQAVDAASLLDAARAVDDHAAQVERLALAVLDAVADRGLLVTTVLDPVGGVAVRVASSTALDGVHGPGAGAVPLAVRARVLAGALRAAAWLVAEAEAYVAHALATVRDAAAMAAGGAAAQLAVRAPHWVAVGAAAVGTVWVGVRYTSVVYREGHVMFWDLVLQRTDPVDVPGRVRAVAHEVAERVDDDADRAAGVAARNADVTQTVVAATPAFLAGAATVHPVGVGVTVLDALGSPPTGSPTAAQRLSDVAAVTGFGRDTPVRATAVPPAGPFPPPARPPRGAADLTGRLAALEADTSPGRARVRIERLARPDGSSAWVVHVPGVQRWATSGPGSPLDTATTLRAAAGYRTQVGRAVVDGLAGAGARPQEPVLLAGYSAGGLVAAQLAGDPELKRRVTPAAVLTVGSPTAELAVPEDVAVLSLEHAEDLVTVLDGADNPDQPHRTTVSRALTGPGADGAVADRLAEHPGDAHDVGLYRRTAELAEASGDPSVAAWHEATQAFWDDGGPAPEVVDLLLERTEPAPTPRPEGGYRPPSGPLPTSPSESSTSESG